MSVLRSLLCTALLLASLPAFTFSANAQLPSTDAPTLTVTSNLVFLDVTVLDKNGHPVVSGLTKDDFSITEDKRLQRISSFESPQLHRMGTSTGDQNQDGNAPVTIFVLDQLNSSFEDFAFIRYEFRSFLRSQPALLAAPAELMVIRNHSLDMLHGYTRSRANLENALDHFPAAIPYKWLSDQFVEERFDQSVQSLQEIALQNSGVPGRKNIVWVGHGGPSFTTRNMTEEVSVSLKRYVHLTANMLVNARMSLFVIYPGLKVGHFMIQGGGPANNAAPLSALDASYNIGDDSDPFAENINFGVLVNEAGGKLFYNRNDVDAEINRAQELGSEYYTLTYQPGSIFPNGKFRRIRVTLRNRSLHALTKAGYFAPDKDAPIDPRRQTMLQLKDALQSNIAFAALDTTVSGIVRHPDAGTVQFTLLLKGKNLDWIPTEDGGSTASVIVSTASLTNDKNILALKQEELNVAGPTHDLTRLAQLVTPLQVTIQAPHKTQSVRVILEGEPGGRLGGAVLDGKTIDAAPALPTPDPQLAPNRTVHPSPPNTH